MPERWLVGDWAFLCLGSCYPCCSESAVADGIVKLATLAPLLWYVILLSRVYSRKKQYSLVSPRLFSFISWFTAWWIPSLVITAKPTHKTPHHGEWTNSYHLNCTWDNVHYYHRLPTTSHAIIDALNKILCYKKSITDTWTSLANPYMLVRIFDRS